MSLSRGDESPSKRTRALLPIENDTQNNELLSIAQGLETQAYPETEIDLPSTQAMSSAQVMPQDEIILVDDDTQEANIPTPGEINKYEEEEEELHHHYDYWSDNI